jgi:diguanylate cyclase (GGDEF)-like protein
MERRAWYVAAFTGTAVLIPVMLLPAGTTLDLLWLGLALATFTATLLGRRLHPPARRGGLGFLSASIAVLAVAAVLDLPWWRGDPGAALATVTTVLHASSFVLIAIAMMRLAAVRTPDGDPEGWIDAGLVAIATAAVLYDIISAPTAGTGRSLISSASLMLLPLLMAPVLAGAVRLLITGTHRYVAAWCFLAASLAGLVGNVLFILDPVSGRTELRPFWVVAYVAVACGTLHPTSARLSEPAPATGTRLAFGRLVVIGTALAALPAIMLRSAGGGSRVPAIAAIVSVALVLWRIARLLRDRERATEALEHRAEREAALSAIGRAAVTATSPAAFLAELTGDIDRALQARSALIGAGSSGDSDDTSSSDDTHIVVPLGASLETLEVRFPAGHPASDDDRRFVRTAADLAAAALRRWEAEEQLRHRSLHDHLTGLPNRALISERLRGAIEQWRATGAPLVVLFIDLDGFKAVNDTLGHGAGDEVLGEVAARLCAEVRAGDIVGRLAGDEFVVVCEDAVADTATDLAQRLLDAVSAPFELDLGDAHIGASIGVAHAEPADDPETLLQRADAAMYHAKHLGKGQVIVWSDPASVPG